MKRLKRIAALFLFLAILAGMSSITAFADDQVLPTLSVAGSAVVKTVPDVAGVTFSVRTFELDAKDSQSANRAKTNSIYAELEKLGVDRKDTKTQGYTIKPIYENKWVYESTTVEKNGENEYVGESKQVSVLTGYETLQTIIVTTNNVDEDVTLVGKILDLSIANGANLSNGVSFVLSDQKKNAVYLEALDEASGMAYKKARTVAANLGIKSLKALTVNIENIVVNVSKPVVVPATAPSSSAGGGGGVIAVPSGADVGAVNPADAFEVVYTPISPGETSVSANVSVIFTY